MACLKVKGPNGIRIIPESPDGNVHGKLITEVIVGVDMNCGPRFQGDMDLENIFTTDGLMVGNAIKKVTRAIGIKHCLKCAGRQRKFNEKGLALQQKIKDLIR